MTERQLRRLVHQWASRLGVDRWDLHVLIEQPDDEDLAVSANAFRSLTYDQATIRFAPWLLTRAGPPDEWPGPPWDDFRIEALVVHELLHLAFRDLRQVATELAGIALEGRAEEMFDHALKRAEEQTVERLAWALTRARHAESV